MMSVGIVYVMLAEKGVSICASNTFDSVTPDILATKGEGDDLLGTTMWILPICAVV